MQEAEHVSNLRLLEVGLKDDPVFTPRESLHVFDCTECLGLFTLYFNQALAAQSKDRNTD